MSEYSAYYQTICTGQWADEDAELCPCRGRGWMLSEVDTWHRCPVHGADGPHPEALCEEDYPVDPGSSWAPPLPVPEIVWGDDDIPF